jgi:serine/threonine protein kinase
MDYFFENSEGIPFPAIQPEFTEGEKIFFGRFRVLTPRGSRDSVLGRGGAGVIHLVRDELMGRTVALKIPLDLVAHDAAAKHDVIRETRRAIELTHPNIVRIHDFHQDRDEWGISMQYVRGRNLDEVRQGERSLLDNHQYFKPCKLQRIKPWIVQLCEALIYAHEDAKLIHRDIKPKNLMLEHRKDGTDKFLLTDFGITQKLRQATITLTKAKDSSSAGTPPYMSPQQLEGKSSSERDDIYAVGATIYDLLTGAPPFFEGDIPHQVKSVKPDRMDERIRMFDLPTPSVDEEWEQWEEVVGSCLTKDQDDRPQSIRKLMSLLGLAGAMAGPAANLSDPGALDKLIEEKDGTDQLIEELRLEAQDKQKEIGEMSRKLAQVHEQLSAKVDELGGREEELHTAREQAAAVSNQLEALQTALKAGEEKKEQLNKQIVSAEARLSESQSSLDTAISRMEELEGGGDEIVRTVINNAISRVSELEERLDETKRQLKAATKSRDQTAKDLQEANDRLRDASSSARRAETPVKDDRAEQK